MDSFSHDTRPDTLLAPFLGMAARLQFANGKNLIRTARDSRAARHGHASEGYGTWTREMDKQPFNGRRSWKRFLVLPGSSLKGTGVLICHPEIGSSLGKP